MGQPIKKKKVGPRAKEKKKEDRCFTLFPNLPAEIQSQIWRHCLPTRRIIYRQVPVWCSQQAEKYRSVLRNHRYLPRVAGVCREAHRVALEQVRQRQPFVIDDKRHDGVPREEPEYHPRCNIHRSVLFNPVTDVLFVNEITTWEGRVPIPRKGQDGHGEAHNLGTLLTDPSVAVCLPTKVAQHEVDYLYELAEFGRKSFYLALGREFTINIGQDRCLSLGLFGIGGDETTVLIDLTKSEEVAAYRWFYNGTQLSKTLEYQIARAQRGWVNKMEELRLENLAAEAVLKVEESWAKLMKKREDEGLGPSLVEMPVLIPVLYFRRETRYIRPQ